MTTISVHLENGFAHDEVELDAGGPPLREEDVTTRYQVGLARTVELEVTEAPVRLRVHLPGRGLDSEVELDPAATPHVRVDVEDATLALHPQATPPMFA